MYLEYMLYGSIAYYLIPGEIHETNKLLRLFASGIDLPRD